MAPCSSSSGGKFRKLVSRRFILLLTDGRAFPGFDARWKKCVRNKKALTAAKREKDYDMVFLHIIKVARKRYRNVIFRRTEKGHNEISESLPSSSYLKLSLGNHAMGKFHSSSQPVSGKTIPGGRKERNQFREFVPPFPTSTHTSKKEEESP